MTTTSTKPVRKPAFEQSTVRVPVFNSDGDGKFENLELTWSNMSEDFKAALKAETERLIKEAE